MEFNYDLYTVYDNRTDRVVFQGTYAECEDYMECEGRYSVVSNMNGAVVNDD